MPNLNYFTYQGLQDLKEELKKLQQDRPLTVANLKTAREMGDLSENAAYSVARSKLTSIDARIRKLAYIIKTARIYPKSSNGFIQIGSKVKLLFNQNTQIAYTIVGTYESNPSVGKISYVSPLGKLLMGKKIGEVIFIQTPNGQNNYKIVEVE